jgi:YbgC/YbaW family acyl-CoA thioester hydrolase
VIFETRIHIRFDDCDPAGIVFFGNFFRLAHRAIEDLLPTLGLTYADWFLSKEYVAPLVHAEADYKTPLFQGQPCTIEVTVANLGQSSVTFTSTFKNHSNKVAAIVTTVHAFICPQTKSKLDIPTKIRQALETYQLQQ